MASEKGPIATETPLIATTAPPPPRPKPPQQQPPTASSVPPAAPPGPPADESSRLHSLKRPRETTPTLPTSTAAATVGARELSPAKIARLGLTAQLSPSLQLTGEAALEGERRRREEEQRRNPPGTSENPNQKVLSDLMSGGTLGMSRPRDAPQTVDDVALNAAAPKPLNPVTIPQPNVSDARTDISPQSAASVPSAGGADARPVVSSPAPMEVDSQNGRPAYAPQPEPQMDDKTSTSLSYPGLLSATRDMPAPATPQRGLSLPMSGINNGEHGGSSTKKHKCPHCETEFTRHHNLKSHLLTHSQEKPYICNTCNMRFRRLHDLKRHSKLHTGEKPHVCPKCDRKFARGDALARHSKGPGGCAGRRASMGSFAGEEDYDGANHHDADDSAMAGVLYDGGGDIDMADDERRRQSLPAIKAQHVAATAGASEAYAPHSRTYPPAGPRPGSSSGLYPPNIGGSGSTGSPGMANNIAGITESPKPLSPAGLQPNQPGHEQGAMARQRSPSLATQLQQQQYGRHPPDRHSPSGMALLAPHGSSSGPDRTPAPARPVRSNVAGPAHSGISSRPGHANSDDSAANLFARDAGGVWTYMQKLEKTVEQLSDRIVNVENTSNAREAQIVYLTNEVAALRKELAKPGQADVPTLKL